MAQYIEIPQDFSEIKEKFLLGLTKRQCFCFGAGIAVGGTAYFLSREYLGSDIDVYFLFAGLAPFVMLAFPTASGMFIEKRIKMKIDFYKSKRIKTYSTDSSFEQLQRLAEYDKLKIKLKRAGVNTAGGDRIAEAKSIFKKFTKQSSEKS